MNDIAIYGAGGFGKEVASLIRIINESLLEPEWNLIGFFDDGKEIGCQISHYGKVIGGINELNVYDKNLSLVVAVGNPIAIKNIVSKISNDRVAFPNLIHPKVVYTDPETFGIGKGNIIQGGCAFSCDVSIGDFNVMNGSVVFGHDDVIGSYNVFMPAIRVSGEVIIGESNFFGVGSIILQQIKIGNSIRLGAGSVLMTKPKDGKLYIGNPARKTEL